MSKFFAWKQLRIPLCGVLLCIGLVSCSQKDKSANDIVVAKVNGEKITEADINFVIERTFASKQITNIDASVREKVLESLISSKAMKQELQKNLTKAEIEKINASVKNYEEELYLKEYLQRHVIAQSVTQEMVQQYYEQHPEQFGSEEIRDFELLKAQPGIDDKQRDKILKAIATIKSTSNWQASAKSLEQEYGLSFLQGKSKAGLLDKNIDQKLSVLKKGETSDVFFVNGQLHIVRLDNITVSSVKPIAEVAGDIRKKLAPVMLREAVKKASDDVRAKANVQIMKK